MKQQEVQDLALKQYYMSLTPERIAEEIKEMEFEKWGISEMITLAEIGKDPHGPGRQAYEEMFLEIEESITIAKSAMESKKA